mgnify:CR=1 FL=1
MTPDQIDVLIASHLSWRERFLTFAYTGNSDGWTSRETVGDSSACELGRMLAILNLTHAPGWSKLLTVHRQFHREAKVIYDLAEAKKADQVDAALGSSTNEFIGSTLELVRLLKELKAYIQSQPVL